ncbi:substrate-binding domain-containing protein [Flavobacterium sp. ASW18X]|uniref:substrate-binding domain-containing protein n=1 Tax=Flavobacterium sp. ASW18X TaxID=2572595 RepID=UPI0010AE51EF|nr:substrate-binding domain-containing protein [Flavobacterium sp. ASW18X]TKD65996.1 ABC transporter substrate-binding protein [Flavobacterium sp. ASW18X]
MQTVKIIGVPEHFNLPWHLAIEDGAFEERGIDLHWEDIPEGTGRMAKLLADEQTDLAIILTEGLVKSITEGNNSKIVQIYVESPLLWGIHVAHHSSFTNLSELEHTKAAISRYGSGSHLMAYVNAQKQGWDTTKLLFEVINNLDGAVQGLQEQQAHYFMWEHFTTKPLVDNNTFRRLGDCPTPWPCFVIAATTKFITENATILKHILDVINTYTKEFKSIPSIDRTLANRYGQKLEDITSWLSKTKWSQQQLSVETLQKVQNTLHQLEIIEELKDKDLFLHQD